MSHPLQLFAVFHLNLAYSAIEEEDRPAVIERCYWPILRLVRSHDIPLGIEASGFTLETIEALDPKWIVEFRELLNARRCEFIGSGYAQVIGPLAPAKVNVANLRIGHDVYSRTLGFNPLVALVNEQAYSCGLIQNYLDAGYRALIMEWDNPAHNHPEWEPELRYLPQVARGQHGEEIPVIWNKSIAFQKFQRYVHGELELEEYLGYMERHVADSPRAFPVYGNDAEIFGFRPGRYEAESAIRDDEWTRIRLLFEKLRADDRFVFGPPSAVLDYLRAPGAGRRLQLESAEQPVPVKKQGKYNITRWAVTGRNDLAINTKCWRLYANMTGTCVSDPAAWRELCYLWSSDFRTHITERRWQGYCRRLAAFESQVKMAAGAPTVSGPAAGQELPQGIRVDRQRNTVVCETPDLIVRMNHRRGLAFEDITFKKVSGKPLLGTLHHGHFDDVDWLADFYSGHLVYDQPHEPKITDLLPVDGRMWYDDVDRVVVLEGQMETRLGAILKEIRIGVQQPVIEVRYRLEWTELPVGSLRVGSITLLPDSFDKKTLFFRTHNGGSNPETFHLGETAVDHGAPVSFMVSARQGMGVTEGSVDFGDDEKVVHVEVEKTQAAALGMIAFKSIASSFFSRLVFSMREMDETSRPNSGCLGYPLTFSMRITARVANEPPTGVGDS